MRALPLAALLLAGCSTAMTQAARVGDTTTLGALIRSGQSIEQVDMNGETPLMKAAITGQVASARVLLDAGADPNHGTRFGTPLSYATMFGHAAFAALLRDRGATETSRTGRSPVKRVALARTPPGNLDDDAYARMRSAANLPPETKAATSDVDSPTMKGAERPDDYALVVGIEKYSKLPEAKFAENDADAVKKHLLALGYPERNIILLKGGQATRGAIQGYVEEWLPKNSKPGSRVFVYFSGHGSPDVKTGDAYLVPWDGDAMFLKSTAYPLKSLYGSLSKLKAKRVLVALDSCFSGAGGRSVLAEGARPLVTRVDEIQAPAGVTVLSAASGDEITATLKDQSHGAFTYYLLKALGDGKTTAKAAYESLKPKVQDEAHRQNREQTPLLLGDDASF